MQVVLPLTTFFEVYMVVCAFCSVRQSYGMFKAAEVSQFGHALNSLGAFESIMVCHRVLSWSFSSFAPIIIKRCCSPVTLSASFQLKHASEVQIAACMVLCDLAERKKLWKIKHLCSVTSDICSEEQKFVALCMYRQFLCSEINDILIFSIVSRLALIHSFCCYIPYPQLSTPKIREVWGLEL